MSRFYGILSNGQNLDKTLRGHATRGLETTVAGYEGGISVRIYTDMDGVNRYTVKQVPHWQTSEGIDKVIGGGILGK